MFEVLAASAAPLSAAIDDEGFLPPLLLLLALDFFLDLADFPPETVTISSPLISLFVIELEERDLFLVALDFPIRACGLRLSSSSEDIISETLRIRVGST